MSFTCLWTAIWHANLQNIASRYVSMQSTIQQTGRYPSKTVNAASSCDFPVTSPDVLSNVWSACRQMETQRSADVWNSCNVEISQASAEKITIAPPYRQIVQTRWKNAAVCAGRYLVFSSITSQLNWNRMLSFWHSPWWIRQLLVGFISCVFLHRLYFTLKKKAPAMSVTVSPCDLPIEWSLAARTLKDKPLKSLQCEWTVRLKITTTSGWAKDDQLDIIIAEQQIGI